jgi:outer membrane immunogenic protein
LKTGADASEAGSMIKTIAAACLAVAALLTAQTAFAADLSVAPLYKAPPPATPAYDWSGFYLGINGGGGWGGARSDLTGHFGTSGGLAGGTAGYNWQLGRWVLGLEGDIDWSDVGGNSSANNCPAGCSVENKWLGTARGRVGYAFGSWLPYVTGGLAVGDVNAGATGFSGTDSTQTGWAAGAGVEYGVSRNVSAKLEYLRVDLGRFDCGLNCGPTAPDNVGFRANVVRGGINFRF